MSLLQQGNLQSHLDKPSFKPRAIHQVQAICCTSHLHPLTDNTVYLTSSKAIGHVSIHNRTRLLLDRTLRTTRRPIYRPTPAEWKFM